MKKLSEAQKKCLERLSAGDEIWTTGGGNNTAFWHGALTDRCPSFAIIHALLTRDLIENYDDGLSGSKLRITEVGRRALVE